MFSVTDASLHLPGRFQRYIDRVRSIEMDSGMIPPVLLISRDTPVFPNLQRLHWVVMSKATIQPFVGFIVPALMELRVDITIETSISEDKIPTAVLLDAITTASQSCPSLESLEVVWIDGPFSPAATQVIEALSLMHSLRSLSVSMDIIASASALRALSQSPSLRTLDVSYSGESSRDDLDLDGVDDGFNLLEQLSLAAPHSLVLTIIQCMPPCAVWNCTISLRGSSSPHIQQAIVDAVASKFGASIDTLSLHFPDDDYVVEPFNFFPFSIGTFSTLRMLALVDVRIGWLDSTYVTNELCRDLARAWPRLRVLHLRPLAIVTQHAPPMVTCAACGTSRSIVPRSRTSSSR
ncbi:hypothetical protein PYCCODRAFT_286874 [Trametes coccinea BRFM310]|uniref:F-box domain-containing protein n=1 Tax=Trametes coccinea (strain BRFM310) TaxID=1353009 RepID=A0A1Y2IPJ9_TRAC3|nr:hypothetical protein PYCCODRAFT_286874 [Trametes coccinea BRFM310]